MTQYREKDWLEGQYWGEGKTLSQIADECCVDDTTILHWMKKHDIERRDKNAPRTDERLRDPEWLRQKYWDEGLSTVEIAEICDTSDHTVGRWMKRLDVDRRKPPQEKPPNHQLQNIAGYGIVQTQFNDNANVVLVHRLIAVAEWGYDAVVDNIVHHKNEFKLDNRPSNLEIMTHAEHNRHHHGGSQ